MMKRSNISLSLFLLQTRAHTHTRTHTHKRSVDFESGENGMGTSVVGPDLILEGFGICTLLGNKCQSFCSCYLFNKLTLKKTVNVS